MKRIMTWVLVFTAGFAVLLADAANWSQFRGPQSNQLPEDAQYPLEWADDKNVQWKSEVPGKGWSSPIVWGDKVFVATTVKAEASPPKPDDGASDKEGRELSSPNPVYRFELYCLEKSTGKQLWNRVAFEGAPPIPKHSGNTYASETPVTDGERVYVYFGMIGVYCYDLAGNPVWKKDLGAYRMDGNWGTGSSPVLHGDHLYLQIDSEEESFLVALDSKTGDQHWRVSRNEPSNWSSPIIWKNTLRTELITSGQKVRAYDPHTGALLWELGMSGGRSCTSPVADERHLYVGNEARSGGGGFLFAVKAGAEGDITPKEGESTSAGVVWMQPKSELSMASPLLYQGLIYVFGRKRPVVNCYDALTGEPNYKGTRIPDAKAFWASPWGYDGKVFSLDEAGTTHVLSAGSEFEVLAQNRIDDIFWASVAASDGTLIFRGANYVYCIRQRLGSD